MHIHLLVAGDPLYVGMDLTIASFDAISEVNMVSIYRILIYNLLSLFIDPIITRRHCSVSSNVVRICVPNVCF